MIFVWVDRQGFMLLDMAFHEMIYQALSDLAGRAVLTGGQGFVRAGGHSLVWAGALSFVWADGLVFVWFTRLGSV